MVTSAGSHIDIVDKTFQRLDDIASDANTWTQYTQDTMTSLATAAETVIDLSAIDYVLDTTGLDLTYTPYTVPTEPTFDAEAPDDPSVYTVQSVTPVDISTPPDSNINTTGTPGSAPTTVLSSLPTLAALSLPTFSTSVPAIDVDQLVATYSYNEAAYTALVQDETQTLLLSVLSGTTLIPSATYDAIYDRGAADIARKQVDQEWAASNLAAAHSMSGLATENLAVGLAQAKQEGIEALSRLRLEQSTNEVVMTRDDMLVALREATNFEGMWLQHHEQVAGRALASAAKAHEAQVAVFNANVSRYNALLVAVGQEVAAGQLELAVALAPLQEFSAELEKSRVEVAQDDQYVKRWLGEWDGWSAERNVLVKILQAQVQAYGTQVQANKNRHDGDIAFEQIQLAGGSQTIQNYQAVWNGLSAKASAIQAQYGSRIQAAALQPEDQRVKLGFEQAKLQKALEPAWRDPDVEIKKAQLQITQTLDVLKELAVLQAGLAQAYLAGSDVALGSSAASNVTGAA